MKGRYYDNGLIIANSNLLTKIVLKCYHTNYFLGEVIKRDILLALPGANILKKRCIWLPALGLFLCPHCCQTGAPLDKSQCLLFSVHPSVLDYVNIYLCPYPLVKNIPKICHNQPLVPPLPPDIVVIIILPYWKRFIPSALYVTEYHGDEMYRFKFSCYIYDSV